jgi:hypothetical protein
MEHAGGAAAAGEPGVAPARHQARAAGRERELAGHRGRHPRVGEHMPAAAAVVGRGDPELAADGVAQREPVATARIEGHAVVERGRVVVDERGDPAAAAVEGRVDARGVALADRQHAGAVRALRLDVAEQQPGAARRRDVLPRPAAVDRPQHLPGAATDPGDARAHGVEPAELLGRAGRHGLPSEAVGSGRRREHGEQDDREDPAHPEAHVPAAAIG